MTAVYIDSPMSDDERRGRLYAGDIFVFCTDGIYETFNASDDEFGTERVAEIVQSRRGSSAASIAEAICWRIARSGRSYPAINTIVSRRESASRGVLQ